MSTSTSISTDRARTFRCGGGPRPEAIPADLIVTRPGVAGSCAFWGKVERDMDGTVNTPTTSIGLAAVKQEIERTCREASRDPATVTLVAVSKTFAADAIEPIIAAGQRVFGENRVQEAKGKWPELLERTPGLELHMIGPLQSNKAREAVALFHAIHSVDRPSLCEALAKEIEKQGRRPKLFVEINTGAEAQKAGVPPQEADAFLKRCRDE